MIPVTNDPYMGDRVKILDHSFHLDLIDGRLIQKNAMGGFHTGNTLILVAKDLTLPAEGASSPLEVNDCIVWDVSRDIYFFTQMRFLGGQ